MLNPLLPLILFAAAVLAGLFIFVVIQRGATSATPSMAYRKRALMSPNELSFIRVLETALPGCRIHTQVSMGALIEPAGSRQEKGWRSAQNKVQQKRIDYVLEDRLDGSIVAVVELDDRTHNKQRDAARDEMVKSAGYPVIRWHSRAKPNASQIQEELRRLGWFQQLAGSRKE